MIIKGDTSILIQMAKWMVSGQACDKVSSYSCLANRLYYLCPLLLAHMAVSFSHVRCDTNKVNDLLANVGVEGDTSF